MNSVTQPDRVQNTAVITARMVISHVFHQEYGLGPSHSVLDTVRCCSNEDEDVSQ